MANMAITVNQVSIHHIISYICHHGLKRNQEKTHLEDCIAYYLKVICSRIVFSSLFITRKFISYQII